MAFLLAIVVSFSIFAGTSSLLHRQSVAMAASLQEPLIERLQAWPEWRLPAPLPRPGFSEDLIYPGWFEGYWQVESLSLDEAQEPPVLHQARFLRNSQDRVVADRAFNAESIGLALLGDQVLRVENDPETVNRQLTLFKDDQQLETTVIGRRQHLLDEASFIADELVLQIVYGSQAPRISRIELLSRYRQCDPVLMLARGSEQRGLEAAASTASGSEESDSEASGSEGSVSEGSGAEESGSGAICAEQWQARYPGPGESLRASPLNTSHYQLRLTPERDPSA
ncbi:MAG: Uncharacterised protein [Prochlorococcus marinus str. MIT 9215]|nr:MAG: Uncharacterised protein [Prochlorococcus marinus str. MIT 9215]